MQSSCNSVNSDVEWTEITLKLNKKKQGYSDHDEAPKVLSVLELCKLCQKTIKFSNWSYYVPVVQKLTKYFVK